MCIFSVECIVRIIFDIDFRKEETSFFIIDLIKKKRDWMLEVINIINLIHDLDHFN